MNKGGSSRELNGRTRQWVDLAGSCCSWQGVCFFTLQVSRKDIGLFLNTLDLIKWGIRGFVMYFIEPPYCFLFSEWSSYSYPFPLLLFLSSLFTSFSPPFFAERENSFLYQNPSHGFLQDEFLYKSYSVKLSIKPIFINVFHCGIVTI